jgi:hypothetical protein
MSMSGFCTFKNAALAVNANRPLRTLAALAVRRSSNNVLIVPEFGMSSEALTIKTCNKYVLLC